jgi:hypothetical protein
MDEYDQNGIKENINNNHFISLKKEAQAGIAQSVYRFGCRLDDRGVGV